MLRWALRRTLPNSGEETDPSMIGETTYAEQPDTPAPVFAAQAFKAAIWGTPKPINDDATPTRKLPGHQASNMASDSSLEKRRIPSKPQGILLTPGTGTSKQKRVSFNQKACDLDDAIEDNGRNQGHSSGSTNSLTTGPVRKRTALTEMMESSRRAQSAGGSNAHPEQLHQPSSTDNLKEQLDEADDDEDDTDCMHDVTVDLNEPHSRSGKYWKSEFQQYHDDAKTEMGQLLKYKELAKSYAKMKDAETLELNSKLQEQEQKCAQLEQKLADMTAQNRPQEARSAFLQSLREDREAYRGRATREKREVESLAAEAQKPYDSYEARVAEPKKRRDSESEMEKNSQAASLQTHKTPLEAESELRAARAQAKETAGLREQVKQLKSELKSFKQSGNKKLGHEDGQDAGTTEGVASQLREALAECRRKDEEIRRMREDFESFKADSSKREEETRQVLTKATDKITELKKEIKALKAGTVPVVVGAKASSSIPTLRRKVERGSGRRSADDQPGEVGKGSIDLVESLGKKLNEARRGSLRIKYREDGGEEGPAPEVEETPAVNIFEDRPTLEKPRWKPFIPRSPRNRDHLGDDVNKRLLETRNIPTGETPAAPRKAGFPNEEQMALLQEHIGPLNPALFYDANALGADASKFSMPPDRRAAAIARIEKRKADKRRKAGEPAMGVSSANKENP